MQQRIVVLEEAVKSLAEIERNDIASLSEARVIEAAKPNPWPWIVGVGLAVAVGYWLLSSSSGDEDEPQRVMMGSSRPAGMGSKIVDKVVNKVVDRALGKALSVVF